MGWKDFFGKKPRQGESGPDPLHDLTLSHLKVGYFVDYDLKTWEVTGYNTYDWGEGDISEEWQLRSHDETIHIEKETDDTEIWSLSRPVAFNRLGMDLRRHMESHDDPPEQIQFDGTRYFLEEFGGGYFRPGGKGDGKQFLSWSFEDDSGERYLTITQWGENDFEASVGHPVEPYQFTNILPR